MSASVAERIQDLSPGDHSCLIFSSPEEQLEVNTRFFTAGLELGQKSVYVGDPASIERLRAGLKRVGVSVDKEESAGRLAMSADRDFLDRGRFSTERMLTFLQESYDQAMAAGFPALRAAGNVAWQVGPDNDFSAIVHYEALLDLFFLGKRMVGMCEYPKGLCPPEVLEGILATHRHAAVDQDLCANQHYMPPELLLEKDESLRKARRVEWMTSQMVRIRRAEDERDRLQAQLTQSQKLEVVGRLASGVAHDFNNLLTVMLGYNEIVLQDEALPDPSKEMLSSVRDAGERAQSLTRQLLAFSKHQQLQPKSLDLNQVVRGAEKILGSLAGAKVKLDLRLQPGLGRTWLDPVQAEQVLMNLAVNARQAMAGAGALVIETAEVELGEDRPRINPDSRPGPHIMLSVKDSGSGMAAATQARIFEPFFSTKEDGSGLGLSTVFGVVRFCGGDIQVQSALMEGTTFKVYFPKEPKALPN
jgi:signal transduction histidine kinase